MSAVVAGPDRFVAVGQTCLGTYRCTADSGELPTGLVWTSTDGRVWSRSADGFGDDLPTNIVWDGNQYIAFGGAYMVETPVWVSPDGDVWERASGIAGVNQLSIARLGDELIAVGWPWSDGEFDRSVQLQAWKSADGRNWQPIESETLPSLNQLGGVTAANGLLVGWGTVYVESVQRAVIFRSADGRRWEQTFVGRAENWISQVVGNELGFIAVGSGPWCCDAGATAPVRAWTSGDGLTWARAEFQPEPGSDRLQLLARFADVYVALGRSYGAPISWLSEDGSVWTEAGSVPDAAKDPGPDCTGGPCPATSVHDMAAGTAGLVAVGSMMIFDPVLYKEEGWRSVVWIAPVIED